MAVKLIPFDPRTYDVPSRGVRVVSLMKSRKNTHPKHITTLLQCSLPQSLQFLACTAYLALQGSTHMSRGVPGLAAKLNSSTTHVASL